MTCMKTGAIIFIDTENAYFRCDAFEIYGVHYFRVTEASINRGVSPETPYASLKDYENWFDRNHPVSTLICGPHDIEVYPS